MRSVTIVFVVLAWTLESAEDLSCEEKGFEADVVRCKVCEKLKTVPDGDQIYEECMKCCYEDQESAIYASGTLVYCSCRFRYDPELSKLVASVPKKFSKMKTKDIQGAKVQLEMKKFSGDLETISVDSWSHENIFDFLSRKLDQDSK